MITPTYVELHCHSHFSLLDGASSPETLVQRAFELGMPALALTDHDAVYGAVTFQAAAKHCGIKPIFGTELTIEHNRQLSHLTLLVENDIGWRNLCYLISRARGNAPKGKAKLPRAWLEGHTAGLIALSGCRQGEIPTALLKGDWKAAQQAGSYYRDLFTAERFCIELQHHHLSEDDALIYKLVTLSKRLNVQYVATNNVHYVAQELSPLQDVLVCIRHGVPLDESTHVRRANSEFYLKSPQMMAALFRDYPNALHNTLEIAQRCQFELNYGLQDLPQYPTEGEKTEAYLTNLCHSAVIARYGSDTPVVVTERLAHELGIIHRSGLTNYFLIVWDIVRFARERSIRCQGRGSAANSLIAYLLSISPIDPIEHGLVFERFLSDERQAVPDIDIDFQADRREEVIQYVYQHYGAEYAAMACTLVTFRTRSAIREVGKALGFPKNTLDGIIKVIDTRDAKVTSRAEALKAYLGSQTDTLPYHQLLILSGHLKGYPRHLGIHNGGMIITGRPLAERVATEPATMPDRVVIQWDKDSLEEAGLIKIDLLGLRILSAIAETLRLVEQTTGKAIDLEALTFDDPDVYDMICRADTVGVFQVESRAQAQVLPRMQPRKFDDLIICISLIRPGPIQGNMVHPYLSRRLGQQSVRYPHPLLKPSLEETLGVILFQEQVLKVARDLSGFTPGQGEQLRRTLGGKQSDKLANFQSAFVTGATKKGVQAYTAGVIFDKLKGFGSYSFPKSHAASFAVLVYQSAWLKHYYPVEFLVALLNNQPMGFWSPAALINDAKRRGIHILPVDIHKSDAKCTVEDGAVRLGLYYVTRLGNFADIILEARDTGPFISLTDFCRRTCIPRKIIENLILIGALDAWNHPRRNLLWELGTLHYEHDELPLVFEDATIDLPPLSGDEAKIAEFSILGLSVGDHLMVAYRERLTQQDILSSQAIETCAERQMVKVAGVLLVHQAPPTAKGFHFLTLEDEFGMMNVIVRPDVYTTYKRIIADVPILVCEGMIQCQGTVINVVAVQLNSYIDQSL